MQKFQSLRYKPTHIAHYYNVKATWLDPNFHALWKSNGAALKLREEVFDMGHHKYNLETLIMASELKLNVSIQKQ